MSSYSIDLIKRSAFEDELHNIIDILPEEEKQEDLAVVINYFKYRMKEIDTKHGIVDNGQAR